MLDISMKTLLETGVHFGHRTRKWNPKMKPYIFTERNNIHIIDLQQTLRQIENCYNLVRDTVADGGTILFVGTKRQAQETMQTEAARCGMPHVTNRWLGGMLTNWRTMKERITELERLERERDTGEWEGLTKKERLMLQRKIEKLDDRFGGIRTMADLPSLLFVVDVRREENAVREANILDIPVIAMVDTNCDPSSVDYVIPANDDAIRAIKLIVANVANAVLEGMALRKEEELGEEYEDLGAVPELVGEADEELLGAATLAKLSSGELDFGDDVSEYEEAAEEEDNVEAEEAEEQEAEAEGAEAEQGAEETAAGDPEEVAA